MHSLMVWKGLHRLFLNYIFQTQVPHDKVVISVLVKLRPKHNIFLTFYLKFHLQVLDFCSHEVDEIVFLFQRFLQLIN
jgi:hypothetical protein